MTHIDRRIRRTKKLLKEALVSLTLETKYESLTIQDITDRADVGYRTFFRHYSDKDALLRDVLETTIMELQELMAPPAPEVFLDPKIELAEFSDSSILFTHIQDHCDLYRVLLRSEQTLVESLKSFTIRELQSNFGEVEIPGMPFEIVANHIVGSTFAMVRWWLDNDMQQTPSEMGGHHTRLIMEPIRKTVIETLQIAPV